MSPPPVSVSMLPLSSVVITIGGHIVKTRLLLAQLN